MNDKAKIDELLKAAEEGPEDIEAKQQRELLEEAEKNVVAKYLELISLPIKQKQLIDELIGYTKLLQP